MAVLDLAGDEAEFGNAAQAHEAVTVALALASGRDIQVSGALTLAMAGDAASALKIRDKLSRDFPVDTMIQACWLPTIQAETELGRGAAPKAIEVLQAARPYELVLQSYLLLTSVA